MVLSVLDLYCSNELKMRSAKPHLSSLFKVMLELQNKTFHEITLVRKLVPETIQCFKTAGVHWPYLEIEP